MKETYKGKLCGLCAFARKFVSRKGAKNAKKNCCLLNAERSSPDINVGAGNKSDEQLTGLDIPIHKTREIKKWNKERKNHIKMNLGGLCAFARKLGAKSAKKNCC